MNVWEAPNRTIFFDEAPSPSPGVRANFNSVLALSVGGDASARNPPGGRTAVLAFRVAGDLRSYRWSGRDRNYIATFLALKVSDNGNPDNEHGVHSAILMPRGRLRWIETLGVESGLFSEKLDRIL